MVNLTIAYIQKDPMLHNEGVLYIQDIQSSGYDYISGIDPASTLDSNGKKTFIQHFNLLKSIAT